MFLVFVYWLCRVWSYIEGDTRCELVRRSTPGILLGHGNGLYKVWNMANRTISVSKHVLVDETIYPYKKESQCSAEKKVEEHDSSDEELEVDF